MGFCPTQRDPSPNVGIPKKEKMLNWGPPAILQQNPNKITVFYGCGFGFKKLGLGQTPAPLVGTKSQFVFEGSPKSIAEFLSIIRRDGINCTLDEKKWYSRSPDNI